VVFVLFVQVPFGASLPSPKPVRPEMVGARGVAVAVPAPQMSRSASRSPDSAAWKAMFRSRYWPDMRSSSVMPPMVVSASIVSTTRNMSEMMRMAPRCPRGLMTYRMGR
jgi:hypothetical protein